MKNKKKIVGIALGLLIIGRMTIAGVTTNAPVNATVSVSNVPTVSISPLPTGSPIPVLITGPSPLPISGSITINPIPSSSPLPVTIIGPSPLPISGNVAIPGGVNILTFPSPLPVSESGTWINRIQDSSGNTLNSNANSLNVNTKTPITANAPGVVSLGVASGVVVATNAARKGLVIINLSTGTESFAVGTAAILGSGITLYPGGVWYMDEQTFYTGAINGIASAAASPASVQESQ